MKSRSAPVARGLLHLRAGLLCCLSILPVNSARADGAFFQFDLSETTSNTTMSVGRGLLTFGGGAVTYDGGRAYRLSTLYTLAFAQKVATLKVGPSLGLVISDDSDDSTQIGLKFVAERYIPTAIGSVFLLADLDTNDSSWFVLSQLTYDGIGMAIELSHGESDSYSETTIALAKRLSDSPVSMRIGYKFISEEVFVGMSINTF